MDHKYIFVQVRRKCVGPANDGKLQKHGGPASEIGYDAIGM